MQHGIVLMYLFVIYTQIEIGASSDSRSGPIVSSPQSGLSSPSGTQKDRRGANINHEPSAQTDNGLCFNQTCHTKEETLERFFML